MKRITTTVIGSYPSTIATPEVMQNYFVQKTTSWNPYIKAAVDDMLSAGIDMVSDGQTRDPFVQLFTRKLAGCRIRDRTEITGKVTYIDPITLADQTYVKQLLPKEKFLVGLITGPFTLMKSCHDLYYNNEEQLAFDFASALHEEALHLQSVVDLISIDEPFFSLDFPSYALDLIATVLDRISGPTRLHVCGDVTSNIAELADMPVDILSHEFKASPHLLQEFDEYGVSKKICLGAVRSDDPHVESVQEIADHIKKAREIFGNAIVQVAPDCGQRLLPREVAFQKLRNLVTAGEQVYGR